MRGQKRTYKVEVFPAGLFWLNLILSSLFSYSVCLFLIIECAILFNDFLIKYAQNEIKVLN